MNPSDFYIILSIGIVTGLLMEEFIGVSAGGMIVPGVLASNLGNVDILIYIFLLSFMTYFVVDRVCSRRLILYGKRKFTFMVLIAMLFKLLGDQIYPILPFAAVSFRGIGVICPALLANTYDRQGIKFTVPAAIISMFIVSGLMYFVYLI